MPLTRGQLITIAVLTEGGVYAFSELVNHSDAPLFLLALPIAVGAMAYGVRGGVALGALAAVLALAWWIEHERPDGGAWLISRSATCLFVGALLGRFVDSREKLRDRIARQNKLTLDLIATANFDGFFTEVNPAFTRVLGYTTEELTTRPYTDFVHPDDLEPTLAAIAAQVEANEPVLNFSNRYRCRDGSYRWLEWASQPVPKARELVAVARDVTDRKRLEEMEREYTSRLEEAVQQRTRELQRRNDELEEARHEILRRLALAAEYRDDSTHEHAQRIGRSAELLAGALGMSADEINVVRDAAPLHDVGKIAVSDLVLLKPGALTEAERSHMQTHCEKGGAILAGSHSVVLRAAEEIALHHHEWWDGTGYPRGLKGTEIPRNARIIAVADVYDALTHPRPYKDAWSIARAVDEMHRLRGRQFDPEIIDAFDRIDPSCSPALPGNRTPSSGTCR
jgi:PAS domain S-box-containing protein